MHLLLQVLPAKTKLPRLVKSTFYKSRYLSG